ncbi:hypothetical protein MMC34_004332 [Xylographa carneopallida]|nr:hypothetical protein [Xylographa carneopallida]
MTDALAVATIIIYAILIQPVFYCLWKHGRHGILGWVALQSFCLLRIIGNAILLHAEATNASNSNALLISNIGLSPLLLAALGFLHEARRARSPSICRRLEWALVIQYHLVVSVALALVIVGVINLQSGIITTTTSVLLKVAAAILIVCWAALVLWTGVSMRKQGRDTSAKGYAEGTKLLYGVVAALPLVGFRLIYAIVSLLLEVNGSSSGFTTSVAAKVCMSVVPEMLATIVFVVAGISTRDMHKTFDGRNGSSRDVRAGTPLVEQRG